MSPASGEKPKIARMPLERSPTRTKSEKMPLSEEYHRIESEARAQAYGSEHAEACEELGEEEYMTVQVFEYLQSQLKTEIINKVKDILSETLKVELAKLSLHPGSIEAVQALPAPEGKFPSDPGNPQVNQEATPSHHTGESTNAAARGVIKILGDGIPMYDGEGTIQKLLEFMEKLESYLDIAELSPAMELCVATLSQYASPPCSLVK